MDIQCIKNTTTSAAYFVGEYNPSIFYDYGAITIKDGENWIFDGSIWHELGMTNELTPSYKKTTNLEYRTNCPNCGAPMTSHKCKYCGTEDYGRSYL